MRATLVAAVAAMIALLPGAGFADEGLVDVRTVPRLEGAFDGTKPAEAYSLTYGAPTAPPITIPATRKLLSSAGWMSYVEPLEEKSPVLYFKKARQGLLVSFTQGLGRPDQSAVDYTANRINANLPFPDDARDIVFDSNRPYLSCTSAGTVEATLAFFRKELASEGWSPLADAAIVARWPDADLAQAAGDDAHIFFNRDNDTRQPPIRLSLRRLADGRTGVDVRVAPFTLPKDLRAGSDMAGLPRPERTKSAGGTGSADSNRRELKAAVIADMGAVSAFYRRELAARDWKEEATNAVTTADNVVLSFSSAEETAILTLAPKYDLTQVTLAVRVKEQVLAARAKAKKEADEKFMRDAEEMAKQVIAADAARRTEQAANLSDAPLRAKLDNTAPVPLPETADNVELKDDGGGLEFDSASSVKALAAFYRGALKAQGWRETPSVINKPTMTVLEFSKGGKALNFTLMQMGPKVNVTADGSGFAAAKAKSDAPVRQTSNATTAIESLEADPESALPVPKQRTMTSLGSAKLPGSQMSFRKELEASVPADLVSVLAFYRSELGKLGWKEAADRTSVKSDEARLAFAAPEGPATLKLGRSNGETTINLAQKIPAAATKGDVLPKPGQAKLLLGNLGNGDATLTINKQTIKVAAGAGGPQAKGPTLDLPPGKYQYSVKTTGAARNNTIELGADDTWGLMIAPSGEAMSLQVY